MKKFATMFVVVLAVVFAASTVVAAPETVTFKVSKGTVTFNHKAHSEKIGKCAECHHKDAAGKEQKCEKCHTAKADGKKVEIKEAMHKNCKDCHKAQKKGPEKCDGCHKK